jgi:hypothetical protein
MTVDRFSCFYDKVAESRRVTPRPVNVISRYCGGWDWRIIHSNMYPRNPTSQRGETRPASIGQDFEMVILKSPMDIRGHRITRTDIGWIAFLVICLLIVSFSFLVVRYGCSPYCRGSCE